MIPKTYLLGGAAIAVALAYGAGQWRGYDRGFAASEQAQDESRAKSQAKLFELGETVSRQAAALETATAERQGLIDTLEDTALSGAGANVGGVDDAGLRRLERRWGTP